MRKITLFLALLLIIAEASAQTLASFTLDDFENGQVNFTDGININPSANMDAQVIDNPVKSGINTSNKVWKWSRNDAGEANQIWAGFWAILKNPISSGYHRIELKYMRMNTTSQIRIKCEGTITKEINANTPASKTGEWETMVFDLYANGIKNINVFGLFPDYYEPIDVNSVIYIDDITVVYDPSIVPPTPYASLTLFDNSADNRYYDNSWTNVTAPSILVRENWQGAGMPDGDKLPVVTSPVKEGTNALRLQWTSADGGDWKALVASIGWNAFDLTQMEYLSFWIYSPEAMTIAAMPQVYFEAFSGNPNATGVVQLSAYTGNLVANTWTHINVPLADLWAANSAFTSKDVIKGVFFQQNSADNAEHSLYLDEFKFTQNITDVSMVSENKRSMFYLNGNLYLNGYKGNISLYNANGSLLVNRWCNDGKIPLTLNNGVYVVKTDVGHSKLLVY